MASRSSSASPDPRDPDLHPSRTQVRYLLTEILGTGLYTAANLAAGGLAAQGLLPGEAAHALVPALTMLALIYALSDLSGAHFNPAVTLAFALRGSFPWRRVLPYVTAQVTGAFLATRTVAVLLPLPRPPERVSVSGAFALEVVLSAVVVMVSLGTADRKASVGSENALAVAAALGLANFLTGPLTGILLNPARASPTAHREAETAKAHRG